MSGNPMKDGGFEMDFGDFNKAFIEYALTTAPEASEKGMFEALSELKNDADNVQPKTPHLEGNLRGDYDMVLEGITQSKVASTGNKGAPKAKPAERFGASSIIGKLIFRMPYAARWHEAINKKVNWSESGVGPKFLEKKLMMFKSKYMQIIATRIREAMAGK